MADEKICEGCKHYGAGMGDVRCNDCKHDVFSGDGEGDDRYESTEKNMVRLDAIEAKMDESNEVTADLVDVIGCIGGNCVYGKYFVERGEADDFIRTVCHGGEFVWKDGEMFSSRDGFDVSFWTKNVVVEG